MTACEPFFICVIHRARWILRTDSGGLFLEQSALASHAGIDWMIATLIGSTDNGFYVDKIRQHNVAHAVQ